MAEHPPDGHRRSVRAGSRPTSTIGPYSIVGADVAIGAGTVLLSHVVVAARTTLGARNQVFQFASIGEIAQDRKYGGEPTTTTIGDDNVFREFVTVNAGTVQDRGDTSDRQRQPVPRVHARRARLRRRQLHDVLQQRADRRPRADRRLGGARRVLRRAPVLPRRRAHDARPPRAIVLQDVPPYVTVQGYPAKPHGTNNEGLRRRGFTAEDILQIRRAYKTLYREDLSLDEARARIEAESAAAPVLAPLAQFLAMPGRGIVR